MIVCSGFVSSSSSVELLDQLVQQRAHASRRRASRAPARCGTRRSRRAARTRAAARAAARACSSLASPAARISGPTFRCFATGRYGFSRPARLGELDQPGAVQHPHVEVQVARVDREPRGELAVRQRRRRTRRAPAAPSAAADGRAPSAARAGRARGRPAASGVGLGRAHRLQSGRCGPVEEDLDRNRGQAREAGRAPRR